MLPNSVWREIARNSINDDEIYWGICRDCGASIEMIKPNAERLKCKECGEFQVYGAKRIISMTQYD